jgi:hypothetical protein
VTAELDMTFALAPAINDRGQIVGHGARKGEEGLFLLTPR